MILFCIFDRKSIIQARITYSIHTYILIVLKNALVIFFQNIYNEMTLLIYLPHFPWDFWILPRNCGTITLHVLLFTSSIVPENLWKMYSKMYLLPIYFHFYNNFSLPEPHTFIAGRGLLTTAGWGLALMIYDTGWMLNPIDAGGRYAGGWYTGGFWAFGIWAQR